MKKAFSLLEIIIVVALTSLVFFLVTPLFKGFGKVNLRVSTQQQIDSELSYVNDFIQLKIVSSKNTSKSIGGSYDPNSYNGIFNEYFSNATDFFNSSNATNLGEEGNALFLEIPNDDDSDFMYIYFDDNQIKFSIDFSASETLIDNVEDASFRTQEGIIIYYINLDVRSLEGVLKDSIRSSASTRIDF